MAPPRRASEPAARPSRRVRPDPGTPGTPANVAATVARFLPFSGGTPMILLVAFLIFLAIAAVTWAAAVALYQTWLGGPDLRQQPDFFGVSALAVGLVAVTSLIP